MSKTLLKDISSSLKVQMVLAKMNLYLNLHEHFKTMVNNILTSSDINTMCFLNIRIFRKYVI